MTKHPKAHDEPPNDDAASNDVRKGARVSAGRPMARRIGPALASLLGFLCMIWVCSALSGESARDAGTGPEAHSSPVEDGAENSA